MIRVILWDIDGTLLDFLAAEREAIRSCFGYFGICEATDEMIGRYSLINKKYWKMLEAGEIDKPAVLRGRFEEFFRNEGISFNDFDALNGEYQIRLGDTIRFFDDSYDIVKSLKGKVKQYAVTNGTVRAQAKKLKKSGLGELFDGVFISDEIGYEKPSNEFFDFVFSKIGKYEKDEILIIGDSLTSDMQGGNNSGILCCWYNRNHEPAPDGMRIDYDIDNLNKVYEII